MQKITSLCALMLAFTFLATAAHAGIFREPGKVCNALEKEGFILAETWKQDNWQDYACATAYLPLSKNNAVPTNISYYAESEVDDEVTYVYLVLNINDDGFREQGEAKYLKTVQALFTQLGITQPEGLVEAIHKEAPGSFEEDYGVVSFDVIRGATDTLRLTIRNRRG